MNLNNKIINSVEEASKFEWIETNGLGGWASSTVVGANTRRYHGLLVAAINPPVGRMVMLSKLDETLIIGGSRFELSTNFYPGVIYPEGFKHIKSFERNLFPEAVFEINDIKIRKIIAAINGENTTIITYEVLNADNEFEIELSPFVSGRDYHNLSHKNDSLNKDYLFKDSTLQLQLYESVPELFISIPGSEFSETKDWYYNFEYPIEKYRGLDFKDDLYTPGNFRLKLQAGSKIGVIISTESTSLKNPFELFEKEKNRRELLIAQQTDELLNTLTLAADQFIVKRGEDLKTIIAGYHWFSDWGRDTMIALPGICLSTGRFDDAKKILKAFAQSIDQGMLPNRFPDYGEAPEYNTVDATLWFFLAVYRYYQQTGDLNFVKKEVLTVLKDIIEWHYMGTRYNIKVDEDGLLYSGQEGFQLTWMDARINDWVVTPRIGKPVEINALWYNALRIYSEFTSLAGNYEDSEKYRIEADKIFKIFTSTYWIEEKEYLCDNINKDYRDETLRPNQLFALSLPYQLIDKTKANKILKSIEENLYTPVGLRSLSPLHINYKPIYGGDQLSRDSAYHQGTVWSWLLGPYIDAIIRYNGLKGIEKAKRIIHSFKFHLMEAGIGTVSEIFDAEQPNSPRGCIAQAWSVGEILRVYKSYGLINTNGKFLNKKFTTQKNKSTNKKQKERI